MLHAEFDLIWKTPRPDDKGLFLKFYDRNIVVYMLSNFEL